jgi:carbamoyl-phosphate synthase large subunit
LWEDSKTTQNFGAGEKQLPLTSSMSESTGSQNMTNSVVNALVLGVGGNVSQGIVKAIRASNLNCRIIGGCIDATSAGLWLCDTAVITPFATSPDFIDWLIETCKRHSVDVILSGVEEVLDTASLHAQRIAAETDAVLIVSPHDKLQMCRNKMLTALWLKKHGLPFPRSAMSDDNDGLKRLVDRVGFPLFAKPAIGKGSLGIRCINNAAELAECQLLKDYVIQEYLAEDTGEFTISTFTDKDGKIRGCIVLKRKLMAGTTVTAEIVTIPELTQSALKITRELQPVGPCNMQMRLRDGEPVCFEINLRYSGTTPIRARFGFNDVETGVRHFVLNEPAMDLAPASRGLALRYMDEIFIDPDAEAALRRDGTLDGASDRTL